MNIAKTWLAAAIAMVVLSIAGTIWAVLPSTAAPTASIPATNPTALAQQPIGGVAVDRLAPFTAVRWHEQTPEILVQGKWFEFKAIDDVPASQIVDFLTAAGDPMLQKHFAEDLVEILLRMGHPTGPTVKLDVVALDTHQASTLQNVPMTPANRDVVVGLPEDTAKGTRSLFSAIRWKANVAEVQIGADATWYRLVGIDDQPAALLVGYAKKNFGDQWQTQLNQESVALIAQMKGQVWGKLDLRTLDMDEGVSIYKNIFPASGAAPEIASPPGSGQGYPKLSPFTAVRSQNPDYQVQVNGRWYALIAINDQTYSQIKSFAETTFRPREAQKRIDEDLVEVMTRMGHPPGLAVKLQLREIDSGQTVTMERVKMTADNRRSVMKSKQPDQKTIPPDEPQGL